MRSKFFLATFFLSLFSAPSSAIPVLYEVSGQIGTYLPYGPEQVYEDFRGTFLLSDPTTTSHISDDDPDGHSSGQYLVTFSILDFSLKSSSYSLTGDGHISIWFSFFPPFWHINPWDSWLVMNTTGGQGSGSFSEFWHDTVQWYGAFGEHPSSFVVRQFDVGDLRIMNWTAAPAASVPEPSTIFLLGMGLLFIGGLGQRGLRAIPSS